MGRVLAVAVVGVLLFFAYRYAVRESGADIERQVLDDAVAQYGIAKRHGNACGQASAVAAAALQAKDEGAFAKWKQVEAEECSISP
jgi:nicotinate-nucleotide pyrophosphorylase